MHTLKAASYLKTFLLRRGLSGSILTNQNEQKRQKYHYRLFLGIELLCQPIPALWALTRCTQTLLASI